MNLILHECVVLASAVLSLRIYNSKGSLPSIATGVCSAWKYCTALAGEG